jgi:hypothetical protein
MATVNKDFKIKSGLVVEGLQGTINGEVILTENAGDQYILDLIGGETLVKSVSNEFDVSGAGELSIDRATVDAYYDAAGSAATAQSNAEDYADGLAGNYDAAGTAATEAGYVASDLSDHVSDTSAHGVTGNVVGTSDTQTLTNKTIGDTLNFTGAGAMTINSDSHIVLTPAAGSSVKWGSDVLATENYVDSAESAANGYTDGEITTALSTAQGYATTAQGNAETYADGVAGAVQDNLDDHTSATSAHGVTGNIVGTTDTQTISNKTLGSDLAAGGYKVSGLADPTANQDSATKAYVDGAISDLVDSAPELLDTLNELAAAIADNPNYASDIASSLGDKVAKAGDSMTGDLDFGGTHKVTSLATPTNSTDAATKGYVDGEISTLDTAAQGYATTAQGNAEDYADGLAVNYDPAGTAAGLAGNYDPAGSAATAQSNAEDYADGLASNYDAAGAAATAQSNAEDYADGLAGNYEPAGAITTAIDALDTDDIEEGDYNEYFTDARAKSSAADLLTGASLTNITITGTGSGLTITAENGVADSDTDDLDEGTTHLYFTAERAVNALEAVVPNFTAVELNSVAKQVAATLSAPTAGIQVAHAFAKADYRSAEYLVKVAYGTHTEISKVLLTLDSSDNIAITEYGIVGTNGSASSISAGISGANVQLLVTTANNTSTVTVVGTLVA